MFKDDYKNEIEKIEPDGYVKYKVRQKILRADKAPKTKTFKVNFIKVTAAVLSAALIFTAGAVLGRISGPNLPTSQNVGILNTAENYGKIYSTLDSFKESFWDGLKDFGAIGTDNYNVAENETLAGTADGSSSAGGEAVNKGYSETTTQVDGVDEADIVKTDGEYIYILSRRTKYGCVKVIKAGETPTQLSDIKTPDGINPIDMYLNGDRLVVLCSIFTDLENETVALIYDISSPESPILIEDCRQSGELNTSRLIGNKLYILTNFRINVNKMVKSNTESYIPQISCYEQDGSVPADTVHIYDNCTSPEYTVISAFDITDGALASTQSVLGGTNTVYASTDNIIIAGMAKENKTEVARFEIMDGKITLMAAGELSGSLLNQFSIDEYKNNFRFVLTETLSENDKDTENKTFVSGTTVNSLVVLDGELKEIGKISNLAPGEQVYSVRFMGDTAYFVTFRQVDPLFSADLSDPANPKIIGALKIPGFSNYLFPYGEGKLLGIGRDADENTGAAGSMKLSMFDISDPANVTEQDKTNILANYSECLYNHKAALVDKSRNIIAFAGTGYYTATGHYAANRFFVYSYENSEFVKKLEVAFETASGVYRSVYIGDTFYIVTDYKVECYDMVNFDKTFELTLN